MAEQERVSGWERYGPITRLAVAGLVLNAMFFLACSAVLGELWPILIAAPSALLALMFVGWAFAGPDIDD